MRIVYFTHSLISDWNHGNAHFLRGVADELVRGGHEVKIYEPADGWSLQNLIKDEGTKPLQTFTGVYPKLKSQFYSPEQLDLDEALDGADLVMVHEWNEPKWVAKIGRHRAKKKSYHLLFHDTHHRAATEPKTISRYDLSQYDGVLAFGQVIRDIYIDRGWADKAWTWHEAADTRLFRPQVFNGAASSDGPQGDLIWVGNWGDEERSEEIHRFLIEPSRRLQLRTRVHGVRYPTQALHALAEAGIDYGGWLANYRVPELFSRHRCTVHIPRRPYREQLPGVPTIRVFEALACGIPLICLRWEDSENLFKPGKDYLVVDTPKEMVDALHAVLHDKTLRDQLVRHGLQTISRRHTCAHRVAQLLRIVRGLDSHATTPPIRESLTGEYLMEEFAVKDDAL
jgi:spore maturation protein CgeB